MKRHFKSILGVTLLEIMLVLAVAAMVVVMSIKYYQAANSSSEALATTEQIQGITAAADGLAQSGSSYSNATSGNLATVLGPSALKTPWGAKASITASSTSIVITIANTPPAVCAQVSAKFAANTHFSVSTAACSSGAGNLVVNYAP